MQAFAMHTYSFKHAIHVFVRSSGQASSLIAFAFVKALAFAALALARAIS